MAFTLEELRKKHPNSTPKKRFTLEQIKERHNIQEPTPEPTDTESFEEEPKSFLGKARDFAVGLVGGGKVAEGAGKGIAAGGVQEGLDESLNKNIELEQRLIDTIRQKEQRGEDTTALKSALGDIRTTRANIVGNQEAFVESLPSNKQVIGSAGRLAATAGTGALFSGVSKGGSGTLQAGRNLERAGGISKLLGVDRAVGTGAKGVRTAGAGMLTGGIEGAAQGAGIAAEQDLDAGEIAASGVIGGIGGGAFGGALGLGGGIAGGLINKSRSLKAQRDQLLQSGARDSRVAEYIRNSQGKIQTDPVAQTAIRQGVDEGTVALIKGSSETDRQKMLEAFNILKRGQTDKRFGILTRPEKVVGETAISRFKSVVDTNRRAARQLDDVAQQLKGNRVNPEAPVSEFLNDLDGIGVKFTNGKPVFKGSDVEGIKPAEQLINRVVNRMNNVSDDAFELHRLKKFIDEQVEYGKNADGVKGQTELILKSLRRNIDELLDTSFPEYNVVNTQFSDTRKALDAFGEVAGRKFNPKSPNVEMNAGNLMRRITSNARSRTDVIDAMNELQSTAEKYGAKFDDDLISQIDFVSELERLFGSSAPTSFQGGIEKATQEVGQAKGRTLLDMGLQGVQTAAESARDINEEALERAIVELLSN